MKPIKSNGVTVNLITEADINFGGGDKTPDVKLNTPLAYRGGFDGNAGSTFDQLNSLNDMSKTGYYYLNGIDIPVYGKTWGTLLNLCSNADLKYTNQVIITTDFILLRAYAGNPASWTELKKIG